jgi:hypothetical protein
VVTVTGGSSKRVSLAARQQLGGPLVLVWDNPNTHISKAMSDLIDARD